MSSENEESHDEEEMEVEDEESSSEEEDAEIIRSRVESLVAGRSKRSNAGSKMASLIDNFASLTQPSEEDVYQTAYGGFNDEADDNDFVSDEEEADDELDSDFDIEETQEVVAEVDDEEEGRSRRAKKTTKMAYEVAAARRAQRDKKTVERPKMVKKPTVTKTPVTTSRRDPALTEASVVVDNLKRSLRTRKPLPSVEEYEEPVAKRKKSSNRSRPKEKNDKVWTQEELLKEAKETERENLASLMKYQLLELERIEAKKKAKRNTREMPASFIRMHSTTMPDVEADLKDKSSDDKEITFVGPKKRERTLISFSDEAAFLTAFPHLSKGKPVKKKAMDIKKGSAVCSISTLRARYFDPVTQLPYASSTTFRVLRKAYCDQLLKMYGDKKPQSDAEASGQRPTQQDLELQAWIDWRKKTGDQVMSHS